MIKTRVGYTGGDVPNATYRNHGTHAEGIDILFDPSRTDFPGPFSINCWRSMKTTRNRQGNDISTSYRSAIYTRNPVEADRRRHHRRYRGRVSAGQNKVVTENSPRRSALFWEAEPEHQDYLESTTPTAIPATMCGRTGELPGAQAKLLYE